MNTEIYTAFDTAGGFNKLKEKQIFYQPHGSGYQIHTDGKNCLLEDRRNGIVAGSNHIRFILWQEWRAVHELL